MHAKPLNSDSRESADCLAAVGSNRQITASIPYLVPVDDARPHFPQTTSCIITLLRALDLTTVTVKCIDHGGYEQRTRAWNVKAFRYGLLILLGYGYGMHARCKDSTLGLYLNRP